MTLITTDELARGLALVVFGSAAGGVALAVPGSPLWLLPAALGLGASAFTVPEVREEAARALPGLLAAPGQARALLDDMRQRGPRALLGPEPAQDAPRGKTACPGASTHQRGGQAAQGPATTLRPREWVAALNDQPDRAPHALITGPTGAGKTTAARALLGQRGGQAVVLSPKISPDDWSGAEVVTLDDEGSYRPIAATLGALESEKRRRIKALRSYGADALQPLTVVLDEVPELVRFVPDAGDFITSMAGIGREIKVRLVLLSTSTRVAALGIKGRGDTLDNFVRLDIDRDRRATLNDGIAERPAELGNVTAGAKRARLQPWREQVAAPISASPAHPATGTTQNLGPAPVAAPAQSGRELAAQQAWQAARRGDLDTYRAAYVEATQAPQPAAMEAPRPDLDLLNSLLGQTLTSPSGRQDRGLTLTPDSDHATVTDRGQGEGSGATVRVGSEGPGGVVVNVDARAYAPTLASGRRTRRHGAGLDMRGRRRAAQTRQQVDRRAELARAYAEKKADGWSFSRAYAVLKGNSTAAREAWHAAPGPK